MEEFNINEVDFFNLDIDKYLDFLLYKYSLFEDLPNLPFYKQVAGEYALRKWNAIQHYRNTRNTSLPKRINDLYDAKIEQDSQQMEELRNLCYNTDMLQFSEVAKVVSLSTIGDNKYFLFSTEQLESLRITSHRLRNYLNCVYPKNIEVFTDELESEYKKSPLPKEIFYKNYLQMLKNEKFVYLPKILRGKVIYNLDDKGSELINFYGEITIIQEIIHLEALIKGKPPVHPITKPLQWTGQTNELATIFIELQKAGLIKASGANIKRLLANNFIDRNGQRFSESGYLKEIFTEAKRKTSRKVRKSIQPLIANLTEKRPLNEKNRE